MNNWINHWLWKRRTPLHRGPVGGPWSGLAWLGTLREKWYFVPSGDLVNWRRREICKRRIWKRAALSVGAPLGNLEGGSFAGDSEKQMKKGSWKGASVYGSWNPEGGHLYWRPWKICKEPPWRCASFSVGSPFRNLEEEGASSFPVHFVTKHISLWKLSEGSFEWGQLYWGLWRIYKRRLWKKGISLHRHSVRGPRKGAALPGTLRENWSIFFIGRLCLLGIPRDM